MNVANPAMRKLRAQLALMHEREIPSSLALGELLHQHGRRPAADLSEGSVALGRAAGIAGAARSAQLTVGRKFLRSVWLQDQRISHGLRSGARLFRSCNHGCFGD